MADIADVESALGQAIQLALYPSGVPTVASGGTLPKSPAANYVARIYRGWPVKADLDADLAAGVVNVSIYPQHNMTRKTTRYTQRWQRQFARAAPSLAWVISGGAATLTGTVTVPLNLALIVNGVAALYAVQQGDTLNSIAATFASKMSATSSGATVTFSNPHSIVGRVGTLGGVIKEVRRQEQGIMVTCWCPDEASRDAVAGAIDQALAQTNFLTAVDGSAVRLTYRSTGTTDRAENEDLFRRDLTYTAEYATTVIAQAPTVIVIQSAFQGSLLAPAAQTAATSITVTTET